MRRLLHVDKLKSIVDDLKIDVSNDTSVSLVEFSNSLTDKESSELFAFNFLRVIVNMFMNYTSEILNDVNFLDILPSFAPRFADFIPNTQNVYATLALNYSTLLRFEIEKKKNGRIFEITKSDNFILTGFINSILSVQFFRLY